MAGIADLNYEVAKKKKAIVITGFLDLRGSGITELPNNLTVSGNLFLSDTGITALPYNLTVGGSLYLSGTRITTLPDTLKVRGSLNLRRTGITALPDKLTVGGGVYGLEHNQSSNEADVKQQALVSQCTEEIQQVWKTFYTLYDTAQKKNPFFKDQPLPLTFLIDQFTIEALASVRGKYPFAQPGPDSPFWGMVFEAISASKTCKDDEVKEALEHLREKYSA